MFLKDSPCSAKNDALRPHPPSCLCWEQLLGLVDQCTHLGLECHVEESRRDSNHVGERQEGSASGPAEVFVSLDVHV